VSSPDFGRRAESYDRIRPVDDSWWELFELLVAEADLRGRRVLDIGCGTGRLCAALAERVGARAWGVDASPEMLSVAAARVPRGVGLRQSRAERLPFTDGWFERAVMWLALHLLERPAALREAARVLGREGRLAVVTFDPAHFERHWLNRFFPSIARIDRRRFPDEAGLRAELAAAGFGAVRSLRLSQRRTLTRAEALERIHGRHISTFDLVSEEELRSGSERAEAELPDRVEQALEWLLVVAEQPGEPPAA